MSLFTLKRYQTETLRILREYLENARVAGAKAAFESGDKPGVAVGQPYRPLRELAATPYVCLRLPTGGGKTLLASQSVKLAADAYLEKEFPLVLWLVPTNTIRAQTLGVLRKVGNANHETLREAFGGRLRVLDIAEFPQLNVTDIGNRACIVVATMQTLRVGNTEGRKVYAHNENLEPHFARIPRNGGGLDVFEEGENKGQPKFSFRNLLAWHRPLVIVDEAHNNTSALSYEVLERVNAACVLEFTATPAADSNILHNVSATELKAEQMIKLPIRLTEHKSWEEAVRDSILTRQRLHGVAEKDTAYIRPIVLFQAEQKDKEVTKEVLLRHLVEQEKIPREKIAVVTGDQKELDGINLFARECPIDFVITVEALKEGWDCSFAYVFCSVANVQSKKDVEQILGRVLRMPYATRRAGPELADLNRAYAHVSRASWPNAVQQLHDRLVDMGFEDAEAKQFVEAQRPLYPATEESLLFPQPGESVIEIEEDLEALELALEDGGAIRIEKTHAGSRIVLSGLVPEESMERLRQAIGSEAGRQALAAGSKRHTESVLARLSPSQRRVPFRVPQLCFEFDGEYDLAGHEEFLSATGWNPLDYRAELQEEEFQLTATGVEWEVDLTAAGKLSEKAIARAEQFDLDLVDTGWTDTQLCGWLERKLRQPDVTQTVLLEYIRRAVSGLVERRAIPLTALVRWRFVLAKVLLQKMAGHRREAARSRYQQFLFGPETAVETSFRYQFDFGPDNYDPHWHYPGTPYQFARHYYPSVGELNNKGQEYDCARALDMTRGVKHWVRNLVKRGFWLPLAESNFYPDFVAELEDGRILVVEHKGEIYATNDDSKEKRNVGALWEERSGGRALFLMTVMEKGNPALGEQIAAKIRG